MQLPNLENKEKDKEKPKAKQLKNSANTTAQRHTRLEQMDPTEYHEKATIRKPQVHPERKTYKPNAHIPR